jgi:hypothetical protein
MENRQGIAPGAWKALADSRKDACTGLESHVVVQDARADGLAFEVLRSNVLVGGTDRRVRPGVVDARTLSGSFSGRRVPTLTRR